MLFCERMRKMSKKKVPWAGFGLQIVPKWRARIDFARMMTRQLSKRFGRILLAPGFFFRASVLAVDLNGEKFLIGIRENKSLGNPERMWEIWVGPSRFPVPSDHFPEDEQEKYAKDLMIISNEIHAVLTRTPGVTRLRWWFTGWDVTKPGVRDPRELPWNVDVSESSDVESRNIS